MNMWRTKTSGVYGAAWTVPVARSEAPKQGLRVQRTVRARGRGRFNCGMSVPLRMYSCGVEGSRSLMSSYASWMPSWRR